MHVYVKRGVLVVASVMVTVVLGSLVDHLVLKQFALPEGLIFPPHERFRYRTSEFSADAFINSSGFRDREHPDTTPGWTRIAAIGDSFTFGWGVPIEQAWVKRLEGGLAREGRRFEVMDLGTPGAGPDTYEGVAARAIPRLKPVLTIVAVLLGDDFTQVVGEEGPAPEPAWPLPLLTIRTWARRLAPNALKLRQQLLRTPVHDEGLEGAWRDDAMAALATFDTDERARFNRLDDDIRRAFLAGDLNPSLISLAIRESRRLLDVYDLSSPTTGAAIETVARHLAGIRRIAGQNGSRVLVVGVPYGPYGSARAFRNFERLGFALTPDMLTSANADEALRVACERAGVAWVSVTEEFRRRAASRMLYFERDDHFNAAGHEVFAELLTPNVMIEKQSDGR